MAPTFTMDCFLGKVSRDLLDVYFTNRHIALPVMPGTLRDDDPERTTTLMRAITALPDTPRETVETDFHDLFYLGTKTGVEELVRVGRSGMSGAVVDLEPLLEPWKVLHDKALWTMLHQYPIYEVANERMKVVDVKGWKNRDIGPLFTRPAMDQMTCERLSKEIKAYYEPQGRADRCVVRAYEHAECTYYCAYPLDYAVNEPHHLPDGSFVFAPHRNTFDLIWRFNHMSGRLGVHIPDPTKPVINDLTRIFVETVIAAPVSPTEHIFDLEMLRTISDEALLASARELFPQIEYVRLKEVCLQVNNQAHQYITLTTGRDHARPWLPMPEFHQRTLNHQDQLLANTTIVEASIQVKFPGKGLQGSVTPRVKVPDTCYLDDTPNARRALQLLGHWGIDRGRLAS